MIDNTPVTRSQAEAIAREVMIEQVAPVVFEYEALKEEMRQLVEGERVIMPCDQEHAEAMFKVASMYLGYWTPGQDFNFGTDHE